MKKLLILLVVIFASGIFSNINAQTEKGTWLLGGSTSFAYADDEGILAINPDIGFFVANNFVLGLNYGYIRVFERGTDPYTNAFGPFIKFYIGNSPSGKLFAQVGGAFTVYKDYWDDIEIGLGLKGGYAVFLNQSVAMEFSAGYNILKDYDNIFGIGIGFQIHFNKNQ